MLKICCLLVCALLSLRAADISLTAVAGSGSALVVTMHLDAAPAFATAGALLRFDRTHLQLTAQAAGSVATFVPDSRTLSDINASGEVRFGAFALADGAAGGGTLGVFTFSTTAGGAATLTSVAHAADEPFGCDVQTHGGSAVALSFVGLPLTVGGSAGANQPPEITSATATPDPVGSTQATLAVVADDDGGEGALSYAWSAPTVPAGASVGFAPNGSHAAKAAVATFNRAGAYTLRVTASDGTLSATRDVAVVVEQTAASVAVSPAAVHLTSGGTQAFTAEVRDQFGTALAIQPTRSWTLDSGAVGTLTAGGVYSATADGTATVRATAGGRSGTAAVVVGAAAPPVTEDSGSGGGGGCGFGTVTACVLLWLCATALRCGLACGRRATASRCSSLRSRSHASASEPKHERSES